MALGLIEGHEHGWVSREVKQRRDEPPEVQYVLHNPKRHHPQRTVTDALLINPPEDLPHLDAVMSHPFLNASGDRLVTAEGCHPEERVYLQNKHPFAPVSIDQAIADLDDLFCDFPFANPAADRTNLYAAIVTRICRRSYAIAPMFRFDKPKSGAGATLPVGLVACSPPARLPNGSPTATARWWSSRNGWRPRAATVAAWCFWTTSPAP